MFKLDSVPGFFCKTKQNFAFSEHFDVKVIQGQIFYLQKFQFFNLQSEIHLFINSTLTYLFHRKGKMFFFHCRSDKSPVKLMNLSINVAHYTVS